MGRIKDAALQTNPYQPSSIIHNFWCRNNCHRHALSVQLVQTHLSFDIWLMLSRGTAAGHRKQRTGKTVAAWVVSDSSSCCASISPFRIRVFPWPKTLRPHQMQIDLMFIHRKSYKSVKMCNSSSELSCIIYMRIRWEWNLFDFRKWLWFVFSVNKKWNTVEMCCKSSIISEIIKGFLAKPSHFCKFANSLRGNLIMTKCPNTHNSHCIFQKSF